MRPVGASWSARARRRVVAAGVVVAVGLLTAACTADEPADPATETSAGSTEESPEPEQPPAEEPEQSPSGPAKPERPAVMAEESAEGAAAAAEYFIEQYAYVMITGDTAEWEAMSHEMCGWCSTNIEQAQTIAERGDSYQSEGIQATIADPNYYVRDEATGIFPLDVEMEEAETVITDKGGRELYSAPKSVQTNRVEVGRQGGDWVIVEIAAIG
jgi:hypothetical protein